MSSLLPYRRFDDVELCETKEIVVSNIDGSTEEFTITDETTAGDISWKKFKSINLVKQHWSISELWMDQSIERIVEYHEHLMPIYNKNIVGHGEKRILIFRPVTKMFEMYTDKTDYHIYRTYNVSHEAKEKLIQLTLDGVISPLYYSKVSVYDERRLDPEWEDKILLMAENNLYFAPTYEMLMDSLEEVKDGTLKLIKQHGIGRFSRFTNTSQAHHLKNLQSWVELTDFQVFYCTNANITAQKASGTYSLCLLLESGIKLYICCYSEFNQKNWMCAMRLSKYGKQLRDNYRSFVKKQSDPNDYEYKRNPMPNESIRSHVAMDFRGNVGRIVEDPIEAQAIAEAELSGTRRSYRNNSRATPVVRAAVTQLNHDVHLSQPWFHKNMTRDQAAGILSKTGDKDGVFLIRESQRNTDCYVLSFKHSTKTLHIPITSHMDSVHGRVCFTLDRGLTNFYDLLQLVEFYQLNAGSLPIRLMHYVSNEPNPLTH